MDMETTFDLLSSSVRRAIITTLRESNSVTRERLTAILADSEANDDGSVDARRRIRIALHHNHLPKLAEAGLITYDDESVTATAELEQIAQVVPLPDEASQTPTASVR
jgi:hypothetical protein